jgi:hypothetical protein
MSEATSWAPPGDPPDHTPVAPPATPPPVTPVTVFSDPLTGEKIPLPSGGWVVFRDVTKLRTKHQEMVLQAGNQAEDALGFGSIAGRTARGFAVTKVLLRHLVLDWSLPYERDPDDPTQAWLLPSIDATAVGDLTNADHEALMDALAPARKILFPHQPTPDDHADPASPTEPANA